MATGGSGLDRTMEAGQDLSAKQFYAVIEASDGQIDPAGTAGLRIHGVLQDDPAAAGRAALVRTLGTTKWVASTVIAKGAAVTTTNAGKCVTAGTGNYIAGHAITAAATDGDIIEVELLPGGISA